MNVSVAVEKSVVSALASVITSDPVSRYGDGTELGRGGVRVRAEATPDYADAAGNTQAWMVRVTVLAYVCAPADTGQDALDTMFDAADGWLAAVAPIDFTLSGYAAEGVLQRGDGPLSTIGDSHIGRELSFTLAVQLA